MEYKIDIYDANELKNCRFALGKSSKNSLFIFGLNPSTADNNNPDQTIMKIMGFAEQNGYTGFVMLNLYGQPRHPSRAPYQDFQKMDMETYFKSLNYADCNKREPRQAR